MAQSDARFGYKASLSRENHDLSRPFGFTCGAGQMLPVHCDYCSAGDFLKVKHVLPFLRTQPLAAPAMVDVLIHMETFFVPMQMIYQPFENSRYSLNNFQSDFYNRSLAVNEKLPTFDYMSFITSLLANNDSDDIKAQAFRLLDMLGLNAANILQPVANVTPQWRRFTPAFFPYQLLAYHTIWNYYFRLDDKSQFENTHCNWDSHYKDTLVSVTDFNFLGIHQRPWNFDYFTSGYRSPIVSDANLQDVLPSYNKYSDLVDYDQIRITSNGLNAAYNHDVVGMSSPYQTGGNNSSKLQSMVSTAVIRQIFANEKLAMITGRTRKNYDSQVLAHLGVNVPTDVKHDLQLIGKDTYKLRIGEVTSLASTEDAPLGEIAGKGWATSDDGSKHETHDFRCPVDGVVMTLFSIEPLKRYYGGFERQNSVVDAFDFPTPEFDRLGNVPMFYYETGGNYPGVNDNDIAVWKERYYQWKHRAPKCTWAFAHSASFMNSNTWASYLLSTQPFGTCNSHYFGRAGRINTYTYDYMTSRPSAEDRFYIPVNAMDDVMLQPYVFGWDISIPKGGVGTTDADYYGFDDMPWLLYQRDPFIVDLYPTVKKVSWMSKDGEPVYNF